MSKRIPLPNAEEFGRAIIALATDFVGLVETQQNARWDHPSTGWRDSDKEVWLRTWMRKVPGWTPGAPYCAAFAGAIPAAVLYAAGLSMNTLKLGWFDGWTAHCVTNYNTFRDLGRISDSPKPGALWLARHGNTSRGHAGIVASMSGGVMTTIEGNTDDAGTREGDGIFLKTLPLRGRGKLRTLGFVNPEDILSLFNNR